MTENQIWAIVCITIVQTAASILLWNKLIRQHSEGFTLDKWAYFFLPYTIYKLIKRK